MSAAPLIAGVAAIFGSSPLLWLLIVAFACCLGSVAGELLERRRGLIVTAWAAAAAACYGLAAAIA